MTVDFDTAFARLIGNEGGYSADPLDPGGETKFGISKRNYPTLDIKNLTIDQAKAIYFKDFWQPMLDMPEELKFQVFDFAVNVGINTAIRKLQQAVGAADDGVWGARSALALARMSVYDAMLLFAALRLEFYTKLDRFDRFGRGWVNRIAQDLRYAAQDN